MEERRKHKRLDLEVRVELERLDEEGDHFEICPCRGDRYFKKRSRI